MCAGSSRAALIFFDDFNSENGGVGANNYDGFANWYVMGGTVDLLGGAHWGYLAPSNGMFVDTDGSTGAAGMMVSNVPFVLDPGNYVLGFDLAGNQRDVGDDSVFVLVVDPTGTIADDLITLADDVPFTPQALPFSIGAPGTPISIVFAGIANGDNAGLLLDNVSIGRIDVIPAPGAILLGGIGAGLVGWLRRRRTF